MRSSAFPSRTFPPNEYEHGPPRREDPAPASPLLCFHYSSDGVENEGNQPIRARASIQEAKITRTRNLPMHRRHRPRRFRPRPENNTRRADSHNARRDASEACADDEASRGNRPSRQGGVGRISGAVRPLLQAHRVRCGGGGAWDTEGTPPFYAPAPPEQVRRAVDVLQEMARDPDRAAEYNRYSLRCRGAGA